MKRIYHTRKRADFEADGRRNEHRPLPDQGEGGIAFKQAPPGRGGGPVATPPVLGGCRECPNYRPDRMKRFSQVWQEDKNLFTSVMAIAKMAKDYGVSFEEAAGRLVAVYQDYSEEITVLMEFLGVFYNVDPIMDDPGEDLPEPPEEYV